MDPSLKLDQNLCYSQDLGTHDEDADLFSPPADPLKLPDPTFRGIRRSSILAIDHKSDRHLIKALVLRRQGSISYDKAYFLKTMLKKSTNKLERTWAAIVLRPITDNHRSSFNQKHSLFGVDWETTDEIVLIKAYPWTKLDHYERQELIKETAVLQFVGPSRHVQGCLGALKDDEKVYIVMPHCSETRLASFIEPTTDERTPTKGINNILQPSEPRARIWFKQLCSALVHIQQKGMYVGNICCQNLLLVDNMTLVLGDLSSADRVPFVDPFNVDRVTDASEGDCRRLLQNSSSRGDIRYKAPETLEGEAFDAYASDIWSAGVVLFVFLTGTTPFQIAKNSDDIFKAVSSGHLLELLESWKIDLSSESCDLLQNMLWRNPQKRLNLCEILAHRWVRGERFPRVAEETKLPDQATFFNGLPQLPTLSVGHNVELVKDRSKLQGSGAKPSISRERRASLRLELLFSAQGHDSTGTNLVSLHESFISHRIPKESDLHKSESHLELPSQGASKRKQRMRPLKKFIKRAFTR